MGTYYGTTPNHFSALSYYKEMSIGLSILTTVNEAANTYLNTPVEVRHNSGNSKRNNRSNGKINAAQIRPASAQEASSLRSARKSDTMTYG